MALAQVTCVPLPKLSDIAKCESALRALHSENWPTRVVQYTVG